MSVSVGLIDSGYWRDIGTPASLAQAHFDVIDGRLNVAVPATLRVDTEHHCCFPAVWPVGGAEQFGAYCWIEEPSFVPFGPIGQSVVFVNAIACPHRQLHGVLLTPWGEIPFDE
jgi:hypothetical protein